jgi:malic enzyme
MNMLAKIQSVEEIKEMSPREQKALVIDSAGVLVEKYAKLDSSVKENMKKRGHLKAWFKFSGKRRLDSKKHYVLVSRHNVRELDFDKLKKFVNPLILKKCTSIREEVSVRLYEKE